MLHLSLNLPKYRLHLRLAKRRGLLFEEPILPDINEIKNTKSGNKVSRFFRHIFEHKHIKKILGGNFALLIIASSIIPTGAIAGQNIPTNPVISIPQSPTKTESGMQLPLSQFRLNQGFFFYHPAVDLRGEIGDPIKPIMAGFVLESGYSPFGYGNEILIDHGNGVTSLYAHLSKIFVKKDQEVNRNTTIGLVGNTGHTTGPHLHLEIRQGGVPTNPLGVLPR